MSLQICICILAAGRSQRFGSSKLLHRVNEKPLVAHAVHAAAKVCPDNVYLVTGHKSAQVAATVAHGTARIVTNRRYREGIGSSLAAGVSACRENAEAIIVMLADQVLVSAEHLQNLIDAWNGDTERIVATGYSGITGPPALFGRPFFHQLAGLQGDEGAKKVLQACSDMVTRVDYEPAAIDIDTPADLAAINSR